MANKALNTEFLDRAIKFAVDAHAGTERRGKGFPYIVHPLEAMEIVATITSDQELLAAAALHDTVEDTDVTEEQIRNEFGPRVASLVAAESDVPVEDLPECDSWRMRKQAAIDRLANANLDAKTVALGDKLSNMRAIRRDYERQGDELWNLFHAPGGKADHEWHYRGLACSLSDLAGTAAFTEFMQCIEDVFGEPKPEPVDMSEWTVSGDGHTAISYNHKDGARMMKLYADFIPIVVPRRELEVSWALRNMGFNVPKAYRLVSDGKRYGVEFERITGKCSYARAIANNPEKVDELSARFARLCRELHSKKCDTRVFAPVEDRLLESVSKSGFLDERQKDLVREFIASIPAAPTCLHGDMHIGNALMVGDRDCWIDLSDFAYGNPMYDFGMFYFIVNVVDDEEMKRQMFHFDTSLLRCCWTVFLKEYFGPDSDIARVEEKIAPFAALQMIFLGNRVELNPHMKEFVMDKLNLKYEK